MIKAKIGNTIIFGITDDNVRLLKDGRPLLVELAALGDAENVAIVYGADIETCCKEIERVTGAKLPIHEAVKV